MKYHISQLANIFFKIHFLYCIPSFEVSHAPNQKRYRSDALVSRPLRAYLAADNICHERSRQTDTTDTTATVTDWNTRPTPTRPLAGGAANVHTCSTGSHQRPIEKQCQSNRRATSQKQLDTSAAGMSKKHALPLGITREISQKTTNQQRIQPSYTVFTKNTKSEQKTPPNTQTSRVRHQLSLAPHRSPPFSKLFSCYQQPLVLAASP